MYLVAWFDGKSLVFYLLKRVFYKKCMVLKSLKWSYIMKKNIILVSLVAVVHVHSEDNPHTRLKELNKRYKETSPALREKTRALREQTERDMQALEKDSIEDSEWEIVEDSVEVPFVEQVRQWRGQNLGEKALNNRTEDPNNRTEDPNSSKDSRDFLEAAQDLAEKERLAAEERAKQPWYRRW